MLLGSELGAAKQQDAMFTKSPMQLLYKVRSEGPGELEAGYLGAASPG
jgi:hypothetical protein